MRVYHMSGAGNDFAVVDGRGITMDFSAMAVALCKRTGADGFMAVDHAQDADLPCIFTMLTVPGARCAATAAAVSAGSPTTTALQAVT